jgi:hypothetical protein
VRRVAFVLALFAGLVLAGRASAHVEVLPAEVAQGTPVQFTVRVPTEGTVATTRVTIQLPPQITVYAFGPPPPGWRATPIRAANGKFATVVYTGGRIGPARYADFTMLGTPFESGDALWKVNQTFADGVTKPWTGPPEQPGVESPETGPSEQGPSALVKVLEPGATPADAAAAGSGGSGGGDDSGTAIWLGVIAIGISLLAVLATGFLWSTRPAKLPADEEEGSS